jgi:hypothetical protein
MDYDWKKRAAVAETQSGWNRRRRPLIHMVPFKNECRLKKKRILLTLQRHFESFPFFEFFEAAFTMGLIGLVVALLMIAHAFQNVGRFPLRIRQTPFD